MESTGAPNKIQISRATANLLISARKDKWIEPRQDMVKAKGKGILQTYWVTTLAKEETMTVSTTSSVIIDRSDEGLGFENQGCEEYKDDGLIQEDRLIDWMVELLQSRVKDLVSVTASERNEDFRRCELSLTLNMLFEILS